MKLNTGSRYKKGIRYKSRMIRKDRQGVMIKFEEAMRGVYSMR